MNWLAYQQNPWLRWLYAHGWEGPPPSPLEVHGFNPQPDPPGKIMEPQPQPWRIAVVQLLQAAQAKDLATRLPDDQGQIKKTMANTAQKAIDSILDDWCGTPPRYPYPWPWPGPPPWSWEIVSELSFVANSLQPGSLRDGIQQVVTKVLEKAAPQT
jgi:hypothetical protein